MSLNVPIARNPRDSVHVNMGVMILDLFEQSIALETFELGTDAPGVENGVVPRRE